MFKSQQELLSKYSKMAQPVQAFGPWEQPSVLKPNQVHH